MTEHQLLCNKQSLYETKAKNKLLMIRNWEMNCAYHTSPITIMMQNVVLMQTMITMIAHIRNRSCSQYMSFCLIKFKYLAPWSTIQISVHHRYGMKNSFYLLYSNTMFTALTTAFAIFWNIKFNKILHKVTDINQILQIWTRKGEKSWC